MSSIMYDATVPVFDSTLTAMDKILDRAVASADTKGITHETLLNARLFPDILDFAGQVQMATGCATGSSARAAGVEAPSIADSERSFSELKKRIAAAQMFIRDLDPASFDNAETRLIELTGQMPPYTVEGKHYLFQMALPNFYFRVTTAYAILRLHGIEIGKRDYLGTAKTGV